MNTQVKCPNCKEVFKVDDAVYTNIVKQVRDQQFDEELKNRLEASNREKETALKLVEANITMVFKEQLAQKDQEISSLKLKSKEQLIGEVSKKENTIRELQSKLENVETLKKLDLSNAVRNVEKQRDQLLNDLNNKDTEKELSEKSLNEQFSNKLAHKEEALKLKEEEIERLKDYKQKLSTKMIG